MQVLRWSTAQQTGRRQDDRLRRLLLKIVQGAAHANPALVLTASIVGATYRYSLLWCVLIAAPVLITLFSVSARIGSQTHRGLVDLLRSYYGRPTALLCAAVILVMNTAMIVANLMAVTDAFSILLQLPRMFFIAAAAFSVWYILIFRDYRGVARVMAVIALPLFLYIGAALLSKPPWTIVIRDSLMPSIAHEPHYMTAIIAVLGSLFTPCVVAWQTRSRFNPHAITGPSTPAEHRSGTLITALLCFAIMIASSTLAHIGSAGELTTRIAAEALAPSVGPLATVLYALGIIGAGMVALPFLVASMCFSVSEAMGWRSGFHENPWEARRFYVLISVVVLVAGAVNFARINPVVVLYGSQILAGLLTVPILVFMLLISNNRQIMRTANTWWQNFWIGSGGSAIVLAGLLALCWKIIG